MLQRGEPRRQMQQERLAAQRTGSATQWLLCVKQIHIRIAATPTYQYNIQNEILGVDAASACRKTSPPFILKSSPELTLNTMLL